MKRNTHVLEPVPVAGPPTADRLIEVIYQLRYGTPDGAEHVRAVAAAGLSSFLDLLDLIASGDIANAKRLVAVLLPDERTTQEV